MNDKDAHLNDLDMLPADQMVLQIARLYMQSVAQPASMAWMAALTGATEAFTIAHGPQIAVRTLEALQSVRMSRRSMFQFNSPTCPCCSQIVTEHERRFMAALRCARSGEPGHAKLELMMLCEGNDTDPALDAMERLNTQIAEALSHQLHDPLLSQVLAPSHL